MKCRLLAVDEIQTNPTFRDSAQLQQYRFALLPSHFVQLAIVDRRPRRAPGDEKNSRIAVPKNRGVHEGFPSNHFSLSRISGLIRSWIFREKLVFRQVLAVKHLVF